MIKKYKSKESGYGYNCTYGGDGSLGYKRSKESIEKTILGNSKVVYQYSVDGTFIRKWDSIKAVEKELGYPNNGISTCCKGKARQAYGYIWRHEYTDTVESIKLGQGITVYQYSLDGNFIKEWDSLAEIENTLGFAATNISVCCKGGQSTSYGYIWSFDKYDKVTPIQEIYYHQYDLDGNYIQSFKTEKEACEKLGYKRLQIAEVCKGRRSTTGGYMWSYKKKDKIKPYQKHKTNNRKIFQYELDGTFVTEWDSITSAIKSIGVSTVGGISGCLSGRYKTSHGYLWSDKRINF